MGVLVQRVFSDEFARVDDAAQANGSDEATDSCGVQRPAAAIFKGECPRESLQVRTKSALVCAIHQYNPSDYCEDGKIPFDKLIPFLVSVAVRIGSRRARRAEEGRVRLRT